MQGVGISAPAMVGAGDLLDIGLGQFPVGAIDQGPELAGINKERLAAPIPEAAIGLRARQKPQTDRDLDGVKELAGERHHAIDKIGLDQVLADLALAGLVRRHGAVGEHKACGAGRRQMKKEVLDPGEVGITGRRHAIGPALVSL